MSNSEQNSEGFIRGLDNLVIDKTSVSWLDGEQCKLFYRGIDVNELVTSSNFEETAYLLLIGTLPNIKYLSAFSWKLRQMMHTQEKILRIIQELPNHSQPLFCLQTAMSALACIDSGYKNYNDEALFETSMRIIAQTPIIVASSYRHFLGIPFISPRDDLTFVENFLYMLTGKIPSQRITRFLEVALILQMDNGFTSSTFTARSVGSTLTNFYSAISAAISALSGSLVGGACLKVWDLLKDYISNKEKTLDIMKLLFINNQKIPGIGHRVYKYSDPRAIIFENMLLEFNKIKSQKQMDNNMYDVLKQMLNDIHSICGSSHDGIFPNTDFWSGAFYNEFSLDEIIFPAITAIARSVGWCAHLIELRQDNCLYRPRSLYVGLKNIPYLSLEERE